MLQGGPATPCNPVNCDLCFVIKQEPCSGRKILIIQILIALLKDHLGKKKTKYETEFLLYLTTQIHKNI